MTEFFGGKGTQIGGAGLFGAPPAPGLGLFGAVTP